MGFTIKKTDRAIPGVDTFLNRNELFFPPMQTGSRYPMIPAIVIAAGFVTYEAMYRTKTNRTAVEGRFRGKGDICFRQRDCRQMHSTFAF